MFLSYNSLPMSLLGGRTELFHTLSFGNRASSHVVALSCFRALFSSDRLRLSHRHFYIPFLEQATHYFGSHFTG